MAGSLTMLWQMIANPQPTMDESSPKDKENKCTDMSDIEAAFAAVDPYTLLPTLRLAQIRPILNMPLLEDCYEIRKSPLHGLGVFATKDIPSGSLIMTEQAVWTIPKKALLKFYPFDPYGNGPSRIIEHFDSSVANFSDDDDELNRIGTEAVFALDGVFKGVEDPLADLSEEELAKGLARIIAKNGKSHNYQSDERHWVAIFQDPSRLNHSCMLSAEQHIWSSFDPRDGAIIQVRAARDIELGEEITVQYTKPFDTLEIRTAFLSFHDIVCKCTLCTGGRGRTQAADKRRTAMQKAWDSMQRNYHKLEAAIERPAGLRTVRAENEKRENCVKIARRIMEKMEIIDAKLRPTDQIGSFMMWHLLQIHCEGVRIGSGDRDAIVAAIDRILAFGKTFKELHTVMFGQYVAQMVELRRKIEAAGFAGGQRT
nr:hypothetical protein B0A51_03027 [Rachicladosporium sp. CCFEE 5018]